MVFVLYLGTGIVWAQGVGQLTIEKGVVKVRRNAIDTVYRNQESGIEVRNGDEIQTAGNSRATIRLSAQGDDIQLFSSSLFVVSNISPETSEVSMPIGKSRLLIKPRKIRKKGRKRFRLKTTNAIIGVKGTDFVVGVHDGSTSLLTLEGLVSMASVDTPDVEVDVPINQASQVKQNAQPTAPVVVPPQAREAVIKNDAPAVFNRIQFGKEITPVKTQAEKKKGPQKSEQQGADTKAAAGEEDTGGDEEELVEEEAPEEQDIEVDDLDELIDEVDDIVEAVIEETETGPSETEVILEIVE